MMTIEQILKKAPVVPVIVIDEIGHALPLAKSLAAGGLTTLEITLRTPEALDTIELLTKKMPQCTIGAGTVTEVRQLIEIKKVGAAFAISPGISAELISEAQKIGIPYLPGVATPSEILLAKKHGLTCLKFYPSDLFGGVKALKNYAMLFPKLNFHRREALTLAI